MKFKYLIILAIAVLFSCNSDSKTIKLNDAYTTDEVVKPELLITPGKSIGKIYLGQSLIALDSVLGKPDFGDAAMGKEWGIWYDKDTTEKGEIAVYSSYADRTMKIKYVKQIRVNSSKFLTVNGLNTGDLKSNFTAKYSDFKKVATYVNDKLGDTVLLYDSKSNGFAAEFLRDISKAVIVHKKGEEVNLTYFSLYPDWKLL